MYHTYLDLNDFLQHSGRVADARVYVQPSRRSQALHGGVVAAITSTILVTALAHEEGRPILLARLVGEAAELWPDAPSIAAALNIRADVAADLVRAALRGAGLIVEPGVLLEPGMFDDLAKFQTTHDLWHLVGDARHPGSPSGCRSTAAGRRMIDTAVTPATRSPIMHRSGRITRTPRGQRSVGSAITRRR
jgi:hypothetical protein